MRASRAVCYPILILSVCLLLGSCATMRRDRCYLAETRYFQMKAVFESTGSYQRVAQAMNDAGWARCEINQFRYRLRKDLQLDDSEFDRLFNTFGPEPGTLDFDPGRVENAVK